MARKNLVFISFSLALFIAGLLAYPMFFPKDVVTADDLVFDEQEATVRAIKKVIPSVVSITVFDYVPFESISIITGKMEMTQKRIQRIRGTGFIVSSDGYILTNRHVVETSDQEKAEYQVVLNTGKQYYAQLIDKDQANDLAVLKIFDKDLPVAELGDSDSLELGVSVIAIGNALGRYENSVTKGIVSGLGRSLVASDKQGNAEQLDNVIQTDAKINEGNSGGPLIDLQGRVVGVNTAIEAQGSAIGFAIPINDARPVIKSILENGLIYKTFLGVRYIMINPEIAAKNKLSRSSGAWVTVGPDNAAAVIPDSPAGKAGILENDIIYEINAIKIDDSLTLKALVQRYRPGDRIGLKIQRAGQIIIKEVLLEKMR